MVILVAKIYFLRPVISVQHNVYTCNLASRYIKSFSFSITIVSEDRPAAGRCIRRRSYGY